MTKTEVKAEFSAFDPATAKVELSVTSPDGSVAVFDSTGAALSFPEAPGHYAIVPTAIGHDGERVSGPAVPLLVPDLTPPTPAPVVPTVTFTFGPVAA